MVLRLTLVEAAAIAVHTVHSYTPGSVEVEAADM